MHGFRGYNQIQIAPIDQDKTMFTFPLRTFAYRVIYFWLCNTPATFERVVIKIFFEMVNDYMEIFMDDFTRYGSSFDEAL